MPDYLNPDLPTRPRRIRMPVVEATNAMLEGFGHLFDDPKTCSVAIVRWLESPLK